MGGNNNIPPSTISSHLTQGALVELMNSTSSSTWTTTVEEIPVFTPTVVPSPSSPSPSPSPSPSLSNLTFPAGLGGFLDDEQLLCDWQLSTAHCRESHITKRILLASSIMHLLAGIYAVSLIIKRNGGFNRRIITGLFTRTATCFLPKPIDCMLIGFGICCVVSPISNLLLSIDAFKETIWMRVFVEQGYWVILFTTLVVFMVGVLYSIPVSSREGMFAYYETEPLTNPLSTTPQRRIYILYPTHVHTKLFIVFVVCFQVFGYMGSGMIAALLYNHGHYAASKSMHYKRHLILISIVSFITAVSLYYGYKFTRMLRANILMAEALLETPPSEFSTEYLSSMSPARYLCYMSMVFGIVMIIAAVAAVTVVAVYSVQRDDILGAENSSRAHFFAIGWTCAPLILFVGLFLMVHLQFAWYRDAIQQPPLSRRQQQQQQQRASSSSTVSMTRCATPASVALRAQTPPNSRRLDMPCYGRCDLERKMAELEQRLQQQQQQHQQHQHQELSPAMHRQASPS